MLFLDDHLALFTFFIRITDLHLVFWLEESRLGEIPDRTDQSELHLQHDKTNDQTEDRHRKKFRQHGSGKPGGGDFENAFMGLSKKRCAS